MSEGEGLDSSRKKITKDQIEEFVDSQKKYLRSKNPDINEEQLIHHARDRVAARLKLVKRAKEKTKIQEESETDSLTKLPNSKAFNRRLREEASRISRTKSKAVVLVLDIDGLKITNDLYGHQAGDQLIKDAAKALEEGSRLSDFIARRGEAGDEFFALLPETSIEELGPWWERVNAGFEKKGVRISAGVAELNPENQETIENSMKHADKAMYTAKALGKNMGCNLLIRHDHLNVRQIGVK